MILSFKNKELGKLWDGRRSKIDGRLHRRILLRLETLNSAAAIEELNLQGYNFHSLSGFSPVRYSIHVNGPWCITFEFDGSNAQAVDFENYH